MAKVLTPRRTCFPIHAEAYWEGDGVFDPLLFDAPLSQEGILQAQHLAEQLDGHVAATNDGDDAGEDARQGVGGQGRDADPAGSWALAASGLEEPSLVADLRRAAVVVTSPLTRAIQTAAIVFGNPPPLPLPLRARGRARSGLWRAEASDSPTPLVHGAGAPFFLSGHGHGRRAGAACSELEARAGGAGGTGEGCP